MATILERSKEMKGRVPLAAIVMVVAGSSQAANWPQWRGPNRDDISQETGLAKGDRVVVDVQEV
jgi:hypothetical protein